MSLRKGDRVLLDSESSVQGGWAEWDGYCVFTPCGFKYSRTMIRRRNAANRWCPEARDNADCIAEQLIAEGAI